MFRYNLGKIMSIPGMSSKRFIHPPLYFAKDKTSKLVITGHNSMLFATFDALKYYGKEKYPPITFFYTGFWLDNIHPDYYNLDWGQTVYGLPKTVRDIFFQYRPHYPQDKFIKWYEYQEVRNKVRKELCNNFGIEVYENEPTSITNNKNNQWTINFGSNKEIQVPNDSFFYGWYRKPLLTHGISNPHTKLYTLPIVDVPNPMFIIGHSLSLVWLLKHFPNHKIINFKKPGEQTPKVPANRDIDVDEEIKKGRLEIYTSDKYETVTNKTGEIGNILNSETGKLVFPSGIPIFAATGVIPEHDVFKSIPQEQKILMPVFDQDGKLIAPNDDKTKSLVQDAFTAPKNLPLGSLPQSYIYLMNLTSNMSWTSEPMFYYSQSQSERLRDRAKAFGIELRIEYFDAVDERVMALENALNPEKSMELYQNEFQKIYSPTDIELSQFNECLRDVFKLDNQNELKHIPQSFNLRR